MGTRKREGEEQEEKVGKGRGSGKHWLRIQPLNTEMRRWIKIKVKNADWGFPKLI